MARYVLALAFRGRAWLMVRNRHRGWEFAGGKVKPGETSGEAVVRECAEETGLKFIPGGSFTFQDGDVFQGELTHRVGDITDPDILEWAWVEEFPSDLGFPLQECEEIVRRAREHIECSQ